MNQLILKPVFGVMPEGFCATSYQQLGQAINDAQEVPFPSSFAGVYASTTPPSDVTQVWVQLDSLGRYVRTYTYAQGAWLSPHSMMPGDCKFIITVPPDFTTYDGGDSSAAGPQSGPMWQLPLDSNANPILRAQFPIGGGTLPSGAVLTPGNTGGEENHTLLLTETPSHAHAYHDNNLNTDSAELCVSNPSVAGGGGGFLGIQFGGSTRTAFVGGDPSNAFATTPHNNMPPYYVGTWIQRTNRLYYAAS